MKKWKLRLFKSGSLAVTAAVLASVIAMPGVLPQVTASETPGVNCTSRIEPDTYIANSLSVKPARNYTALYNDGMYDGGDQSLMLPMGPLMYSTGEANQVGELTYRLPYAVSELKITGVEVPDDANNAFKGFWISKDGYNWTAFSMSRIRTADVVCSFATTRKGVDYYGASSEPFRYVKVALGGKSVNGINYLYIPPAGSMETCTEKVDPAAEGVVIAETNTAANVTLARHNHSNSWTHDGIKGMAYNGVPNNGAKVTFKLPYAVGSLKMTGTEVYWPTAEARGSNRFLSFEVSADGENWTPFAMAGSDFAMVNNPGVSASNNPPKVALPIYRLGVTYYGTSDTQFQYVRIAFGRDWAPQLCNFYLPAEDRGESCTTKVDPVDVFKSFSGTGNDDTTCKRDNTHKYDETGIFTFADNRMTGSGKMVFEMPYAVNELKMTGIEIITAAVTETERPDLAQFRFTGFRVSADGKNWTDFFMERTLDGVVSTDAAQKRREGVILYGASSTAFKYIEVTFGKNWIPGISWFYIPKLGVESFEISGDAVLYEGEDRTYTLITKPAYAVLPDYTWSVENGTGAATITQEGVLTATTSGTVTVKVTANDDSGLTASKTVTILSESGTEGCTVKVDPADTIQDVLGTGFDDTTYGRNTTYKYDGTGIYCFWKNAPNGGKMVFKMPYPVNELKMTGVEIITKGNVTNPPNEFRFKGFRVSADGQNWTDLEMARTLDGFVDGETERREGVILYGASDTEFRYVEVTFGKDWIPGISWFYLPEPEIMLNHYDLTVYSKGPVPTLEATLREGVTGEVTWSSSAPSVMKVDGSGRLTAVAPGTAVITAAAGGFTAECEVTVKEGYGPDGCTTVIDAYAYIGNTSSVSPSRTGTIPIPGGVTYPMVFGTATFDDEPIFTYKLPHAVKELKMTGIEDAGAVGVKHSFEWFQVSADGENWTDFEMTRRFDGGGWIGVTLYGKADEAFRYFRVKFTTNAGWCPGIGHLYIPPADPGPEADYGVTLGAAAAKSAEAEDSGASFARSENTGAWRFTTDTLSYAPGQVTYYFPYVITAYKFNVVDSFDPDFAGGFTYWASKDGVTYTQLDTASAYGTLVKASWRAYETSAYGTLDEEDGIQYLQVRMSSELTSEEPGLLSLQLNAVDYPEREPLPAFETPDTAAGERELLDRFEGEGLTSEEGGKASEAFQMVHAQIDTDGHGTMADVLTREPGYSDSYLVYRTDGDATRVDIRGYRMAGCADEVWLWTSSNGEDWEFLEDYDWTEIESITGGPAEFSIASSQLPAGTRYIKVELPIVETVTDLSLYAVQILYDGGEPLGPGGNVQTGASTPVLALLFTAALSGVTAVAAVRKGRRKERNASCQ